MPYNKTNWSTAKITADNFNKMQEQYIRAVEQALMIRYDTNYGVEAEVVSSFPTPAKGRIIFHTYYKSFFFGNGTKWLLEPRNAYWGNASLGNFSSEGDVMLGNDLNDTVVLNYETFTLNEGHKLYTSLGFDNAVRARCLIIRATRGITINGEIKVEASGGERYITIGGTQYDLLGGLGGNGGNGGQGGGNGGSVDAGQRQAGGAYGGGGGGGAIPSTSCLPGDGGDKNYYETDDFFRQSFRFFGPGCSDHPSTALRANGFGGFGAVFIPDDDDIRFDSDASGPAYGGGGAYYYEGFLNVSGAILLRGQPGGGSIILISPGPIEINGTIDVSGGNGGQGNSATTFNPRLCGGGGGGGGQGGGKVIVLKGLEYSVSGSIDVSGGAGGVAGQDSDGNTTAQDGQPGQDGSIDVFDI